MGKAKAIREAVEAELRFDPLVDPTGITVRNMNGDVTLTGTAPNYPQYLEAATAVQRVAGVKNVHNHLEVRLPHADYRDDAMLTTAVNNALRADVTVPDTVEGTARNGNLTLTGHVSSGSLRKAAELAVSRLTGVRNIKNEIAIWADADPVSVTLFVQSALERSALVPDDSDVLVDTRGNTVTLTGHVRTWAEHDAAAAAAWMTTGVMDVVDKLYITGRPHDRPVRSPATAADVQDGARSRSER
jgi:osmotically-inducible protein OsmY